MRKISYFFSVFLFFGQVAFANEKFAAPILRFGEPGSYQCSFHLGGDITSKMARTFINELEKLRSPNNCQETPSGIPAKQFIKSVTISSSNGGDVNAAMQIAKAIKTEKLNTHINTGITFNGCISACSIIFASGINRHLSGPTWFAELKYLGGKPFNKNRIAIHKPDYIEQEYDFLAKEKLLDDLKYQLIEFLRNDGVDPRFTIAMFERPFSELTWLDGETLLLWQVVNEISFPPEIQKLRLTENNAIPFKLVEDEFAFTSWLEDNARKAGTSDYQTVEAALREVRLYTAILGYELLE